MCAIASRESQREINIIKDNNLVQARAA